MNTILWILQILLCIKFLSAAYSHGIQQNNSTMQQSIKSIGAKGPLFHKFISVILFIGSIIIILPGVLGMSHWITVYSAILLVLLLTLSILFHIRYRLKPLIFADGILMMIAAFVAFGRGFFVP
jgi:VIT1/CCC1 family predicted Fe2+/Mn2+ transporter